MVPLPAFEGVAVKESGRERESTDHEANRGDPAPANTDCDIPPRGCPLRIRTAKRDRQSHDERDRTIASSDEPGREQHPVRLR